MKKIIAVVLFVVSYSYASFESDSIQIKNQSIHYFWAMKKAQEKATIKSYDSIPYENFKPTIKGKLQLSFN